MIERAEKQRIKREEKKKLAVSFPTLKAIGIKIEGTRWNQVNHLTCSLGCPVDLQRLVGKLGQCLFHQTLSKQVAISILLEHLLICLSYCICLGPKQSSWKDSSQPEAKENRRAATS